MKVPELDAHITEHIQGVFGQSDMAILKEHIEQLHENQVYLEIGVDEGRSTAVASHYADPDIYVVGIDINDVPPHELSDGRAQFAMKEGIIGIGKKGFFVHGDADEFSKLWLYPIDLMFIDGHHDYESVKNNTLIWEKKMAPGGTILFHDYDHPETKEWLDEHYGDNKELLNNKIIRVRV
jgi:predicted O-methyltransferase YrrM